LFTGILLRSIGWDVNIYERSDHDLDGGGIVLPNPMLLKHFNARAFLINHSVWWLVFATI